MTDLDSARALIKLYISGVKPVSADEVSNASVRGGRIWQHRNAQFSLVRKVPYHASLPSCLQRSNRWAFSPLLFLGGSLTGDLGLPEIVPFRRACVLPGWCRLKGGGKLPSLVRCVP